MQSSIGVDPNPFVSIIILNFNGKAWFAECLDSLLKLDYPRETFEVIVGDNASTDDSVEFIRQNYPWVKLIVFDDNYGFCRSNNLCAAQAKGEYLAFLNNDTFVTPGWLRALVRGIQSEPDIVSCASRILYPHLGEGKFLNAAGGIIAMSGAGLYEGWMEEDGPAYDIPKYTGFGCGAGVMFRKDFFIKTGGFEEYYFYGLEEMDIGLRSWLYGYKVFYAPDALMYHYGGKTGYRQMNRVTPAMEYLMMRNTLYFILKNFQMLTLPKAFFLCFARGIAKSIYALCQGNVSILGAILRGTFQGIRDFGQALLSRRNTQRHRKLSDRELIELGVMASFLKTIQINRRMARRMKHILKGNWYDTKDSVDVVTNQQGRLVFRKKT